MNDSDQRVVLTPDQAKKLLPERDFIHTFRQVLPGAGTVLIGADLEKPEVEAEIDKCRCELAGPTATAMNHGLTIFTADGVLFVETASP